MPRRPRIATGGLAYHVLNRRVGRLPLFETAGDYAAFGADSGANCGLLPHAHPLASAPMAAD